MSQHDRPDPGGQFATDGHRRVMAALPNPDDDPVSLPEFLTGRVAGDDYFNPSSEDELEDILDDLKAEGYAKETKDGWKNTPKGFDVLTGPIADEPPPVEEPA